MQSKVSWAGLLFDAVNNPGIISQAYSAFHNYSVGNQMLAMSQCIARNIPIGPIATYKRWQTLKRNVKKGERALHLFMPVTITRKDDAGEKTGDCFQTFILKNNWFTLSQTEGEDFISEVVSPQWDAALALPALDVSAVPFELSNGNCQGYASGRTIAINPIAALPHKTRFHELAHVVLGHTSEGSMEDDDRTPKDIREVEAESVALICCAHLGLPGQDEARGYIQSWGASITDKSAQRIFGAAEKILKAGRKPIQLEGE